MTWKFNPLTTVDHNEWRLPRGLFLLVHVAVGLPAALLLLLHAPAFSVALFGAALAILDKCMWVDWHRTSGQLLHFFEFDPRQPHDWADFMSDFLLTLQGAFAPLAFTSWRAFGAWWGAFYLLSTFNGT